MSSRFSKVPASSREGKTYIVMGEDELRFNTFSAAILLIQPSTILIDSFSENRPFHTADKISPLVHFTSRSFGLLLVRLDPLIDELNDFFASIDPLVPIFPHEGAANAFFFQELYTVVQLSHTFCDVLRRLGNAQIRCCEGASVEKLLESSIYESAKKARPDPLTSQSAQDR